MQNNKNIEAAEEDDDENKCIDMDQLIKLHKNFQN